MDENGTAATTRSARAAAAPVTRADDAARPERRPPAAEPMFGPPPVPRAWWRRQWMVPLAVAVVGFLALSLPRYLSGDRTRTPVQLNPGFPLHYPLLVAHVMFGSIALVGVCFQMWTWLRDHHPRVHRAIGRTYIFAGVIPTGLLALAIMPFSHGPAGNAVAAALWLTTTVAGFRAVRQRRYAAHRRWMIYSFALTMQIIWGRVMFVVLALIPGVDLSDPHTLTLVFDTAAWIGFVINLLAAQWWLERNVAVNIRRQPS